MDSNHTTTPNSGRLAALDAVRGLAIVLVIVGHYLPMRLVTGAPLAVIGPCALGGVTLFFMLSGFLIERHLSRDKNPIRYATRRFFRIWPAYLFCLLIILLLDWFANDHGIWSARDVTANAALLQDIFGTTLMSGVFWTLLIEIKFYAIAPIIMRLGPYARNMAPYIIISANALVFVWRGEASNLMTYIVFCFIGMQIGQWSRGEISMRAITILVVVAAGSSLVFTPYFRVGLAIFVLIDAAIVLFAIRRRFHSVALSFIGQISYSWYLFHAVIGYPLMARIIASLDGHSVLSAWIAVSAGVAATIFASWISYRLVEFPGMRLGQQLERLLSSTAPATAGVAEKSSQ